MRSAAAMSSPLRKTALHRAVVKGELIEIQQLIKMGANPAAVDDDGNTPIMIAATYLRWDIVYYLLSLDCNPLQKNRKEKSLLNIVLSLGNTKDMDLLVKPIKEAIYRQVKKWQDQRVDIMGIAIDAEGSVKLLKSTEMTEDFFEKNAPFMESISTRYRIPGQPEKTSVIKSGNKMVSHVSSQQKKYSLAPLLFLASHDRNFSYKFILSHLPYLTLLGYRLLCIEFDESLNLQKTIQHLANAISLRSISIPKLLHDFLLEIQKNALLRYQGIDKDLLEFRQPEFEEYLMSDELTVERQQKFAKHLTEAADKEDGGIIVILGMGHVEFTQYLIQTIGARASDFRLFFMIEGKCKLPIDNSPKSVLVRNELTFSLPHQILKKVEGDNALTENFKKTIRNYLQIQLKEREIKEYDESVSPVLLRVLQRINSQFLAKWKKSDHIVDAILTLPTDEVAGFEEKAAQIQSRCREIIPRFRQVRLDDRSLRPCLVIEDINGEGPNRESIARLCNWN